MALGLFFVRSLFRLMTAKMVLYSFSYYEYVVPEFFGVCTCEVFISCNALYATAAPMFFLWDKRLRNESGIVLATVSYGFNCALWRCCAIDDGQGGVHLSVVADGTGTLNCGNYLNIHLKSYIRRRRGVSRRSPRGYAAGETDRWVPLSLKVCNRLLVYWCSLFWTCEGKHVDI